MRRGDLSVALAQPACVPYDIDANATAHADAIRTAAARVVVFPELSLTGYHLDADAITIDDPRLAPIITACADTASIALVGVPVVGDYIATLAIGGTGATVAYRKMWVDSSESRFIPGAAPAAIEVDGWRLGLAICKDTGIAQHAADTTALGIDAYLAGTVMHRHEEQTQDARGRRIATDHGVWVGFASFAGRTGEGYDDALGCGAIWSPDGTVVARAGDQAGAITRATLRDA